MFDITSSMQVGPILGYIISFLVSKIYIGVGSITDLPVTFLIKHYGLGLRGVVYADKELNIYADIEAGRIYAVAGFRFQHSAHFATGWGLGYGHQFFGHQIVPFIEIDYRSMGSRWSVTGQFPIKPKILYRVSARFSAGLELSGEAASFRLTDKNYATKPMDSICQIGIQTLYVADA